MERRVSGERARAVSQVGPEQVAQGAPASGTTASDPRARLERSLAAAVRRHGHHLAKEHPIGLLAHPLRSDPGKAKPHDPNRTTERVPKNGVCRKPHQTRTRRGERPPTWRRRNGKRGARPQEHASAWRDDAERGRCIRGRRDHVGRWREWPREQRGRTSAAGRHVGKEEERGHGRVEEAEPGFLRRRRSRGGRGVERGGLGGGGGGRRKRRRRDEDWMRIGSRGMGIFRSVAYLSCLRGTRRLWVVGGLFTWSQSITDFPSSKLFISRRNR